MKKMIAKTIKGKEFIYSKSTAHAVPTASAYAICDALNECKYQLTDDQVWHVYDCDWYELEFTNAGLYRFTRRNGYIYESRYY